MSTCVCFPVFFCVFSRGHHAQVIISQKRASKWSWGCQVAAIVLSALCRHTKASPVDMTIGA